MDGTEHAGVLTVEELAAQQPAPRPVDPSAPLPPGVGDDRIPPGAVDTRIPEAAIQPERIPSGGHDPDAPLHDTGAAPPGAIDGEETEFTELEQEHVLTLEDALTGAVVFMRFTRDGVTVEKTFNATDSEAANGLVEELRLKLMAIGVKSPARLHDFPEDGQSAICTNCGARRWQADSGLTCQPKV